MKFNGERLKSGRLLRQISIQELAEKVELSRQVVSQYESGRSIPSNLAKIKEISDILDFAIRLLFFKIRRI